MLNDHALVSEPRFENILYERRPVIDAGGNEVEGIHNVWIVLDNPKQLNSYTTAMVKEVILAFRKASAERDAACVVFTSVGDRSFCTGTR